jgi:nucleotide-binding universal stress UspA family protein
MTSPDRPILIAYDGSASAAGAITASAGLLAGRRACVCHVWARLSRPVFHSEPSDLPRALRDAADQLDRLELDAAERTAAEGVALADDAGFEAEPLCVTDRGRTWQSILDAAEQVHASVVVAGAQGMSGVRRALLGSVSTGLVQHAHRPVLVVPGSATIARADGPSLLCYDRSDRSAHAIDKAAELLARKDVLVLHIWESWVAQVPALAGLSGSVVGMAIELDEIADEQSEDLAARGVRRAQLAGLDAAPLSGSATGPVWRAILELADEHASSAIVLGSQGLTGLSAALGSVSNGVLHHSARPVLVVPAGAALRARNGAET